MKLYKTRFSRFAEIDLLEILDFYHGMNPPYTEKLFETIEKKVASLKEFPERGRIVPELEGQNILSYREIIVEFYRIIYSIQDEIVTVHAVIDGRRNLEDILLKKLLHFYQ